MNLARMYRFLFLTLALAPGTIAARDWQPPVLDGPFWGPRGLGKISYRLDRRLSTLDLRQHLRELITSPLLQAKARDASFALQNNPSGWSEVWQFYHRNTPICGYSLRISQLADGRQLGLGEFPSLAPDAIAPSAAEWPDQARAAASVSRAWVFTNGAASSWQKTRAQRCYSIHEGELYPAWQLQFHVDGLPYEAVADETEVFAIHARYLKADGSARVYPWNAVVSPALVDLPLTGLLGNGSLSDSVMSVSVPSGYAKATSSQHTFIYDPDDERFAQASVFAHAQRHRRWFESLGVAWPGNKPMQIRLHARVNGNVNNALYIPGDDEQAASISIGDGDGKELQNLALDADVIGHELGHHVVFQTLKKTDGESLLIHEALADFFQFAHSGDPCLGESICPIGSDACVMEAQCLRSAAISLRYGDDTWTSWAGSRKHLGHMHSQVLSAMLWDLRIHQRMELRELSQLVLRAVSLLGEDSGMADFFAALFAADQELSRGKSISKIREAATARGLQDYLTDDANEDDTKSANRPESPTGDRLGSETESATSASISREPSPAPDASGRSQRDRPKPICGVTGILPGNTSNIILGLLGFLAPLVISWVGQGRERARYVRESKPPGC